MPVELAATAAPRAVRRQNLIMHSNQQLNLEAVLRQKSQPTKNQ
jgi:hypothetical protein